MDIEVGGQRHPIARVTYPHASRDNHEPMIVLFDCAAALPSGSSGSVYDGPKKIWDLTGIQADPSGARQYRGTGPG